MFISGCYNTVTNNIILNNNGSGISIQGSDNIIHFNNVSNNNHGIGLGWTSNNIISYNNVISNNGCGIDLYLSDNNTIINNIISKNKDGILLTGSDNTFKSNHITLSKNDGIHIYYIARNNMIIKNNFIGNKRQAFFEEPPFNRWRQNYWNRPRILPKLIFGFIQDIPWFNIDWLPAKEPYDIEVVI